MDILASVSDADGHPIPDLTQDAFTISEQGVPQKIERFEAETNRPLDLALMVDSSMSALKDLRLETRSRNTLHPASGAAWRHSGRI